MADFICNLCRHGNACYNLARDFISARIDNKTVKAVIFIIKTAIWEIVDLIVRFYFQLYWWSDRTWTRVRESLGGEKT